MRVLLAAIVQMVLFLMLGTFNFVFRRRRLVRYCYNSIYLTTRYLLGCQLTTEPMVLKDKVLLISNHPTILDFIYIIHWAMAHNRVEDLRFIAKDAIGNIPFFGQYIKQSQCLISRDFEKDYDTIRHFCTKISQKSRYILVIFPEGTTICPETKEKSLAFAKSNQKPVFANVLYPRHRGLELILKHLVLEQFIDITLFYNDDRSCYKCNYDIDVLFDSFPKSGVIIAKEIELKTVSIKSLSQILEQRWIAKEKFLKGINAKK
jgi:1-acyl-sn-glycerol-3-phosphate acyltransferase